MNQQLITLSILLLSVFTTLSGQTRVLKLGVSDLFFNTLNVEHEYAINSKSSILLEGGIQLSRNIPGLIINKVTAAGEEKERNIRINAATYRNFSIAGSYRHYTGKQALKGFYVGPYLRYSNYKTTIDGLYDNNDFNRQDIQALIEGEVKIFSIGAEIGYQWVLNNKMTIAWNILGVGASFNNVNLNFTSNDEGVFESWQQDVQNFLDDLPQGVGNNFDLTADNVSKTIAAKANFPFISLRGSISFGYAF